MSQSQKSHAKIKDLPQGRQSGFVPLIAILIVAVLIAAGGTGYYFYLSRDEVLQDKTSQKLEEIGEEAADETADWKVYENEKYGYFFKYPLECRYGSWTSEIPSIEHFCFLSIKNPDDVLLNIRYVGEENKLVSAAFSVCHCTVSWDKEPDSPCSPADFLIHNPPPGTELVNWLKENYKGLNGDIPDKPNFEIDGIQAVKVLNEFPLDSPNERIFFIKNDRLFDITLWYVDKESNKELYNQILFTFKFVELEEVDEEAPKVKEKPYIKVISPNGGEKWKAGETYDIIWTASGVDKVVIDAMGYGPGNGGVELGKIDAILGKFFWKIDPNVSYVPGNNLKIRITEASDSAFYDESDNYFSIIERETSPSINEIDIFLFKNFKTCIVGDKCTTGSDKCISVTRKDDIGYLEFEDNNNFKALKPSDSTIKNYQQKICLNPVLDNTEIEYLKNEVNQFISEVNQWTNESISLFPKFIEISGEITMSKWGQGLYVAPWNAEPLIKSFITKDTDFVTVSNDMYDDVLNIVIPVPACGGTLGSDVGVGGAGYNWVPKTHPGVWFECANKGNYMHEWLNLMDWVLFNVSGISDIYKDGYPSCGQGNQDTYLWFPSASYNSTKDPDFEACGQNWGNYCESVKPEDCNLIWHKHILTEHYNTGTNLIGNYCRNGKQDFDETGIDCGGKCVPCM